MSRWDELFTRMRRLESARLEAARREREAEGARRDRPARAEPALDALWRAGRVEVEARVAEFTASTGRRIDVVRHLRTLEASTGSAALRILELKLGDSVVYLYSHHATGAHVHVHVAQWPAADGKHRRHHRMISLPVCTLERVGQRDWALCRVSPTAAPRSLKVEDVVYRAFELLVFSLERADSQVLGLRAASEPDPRSSKTVMQFPD